VADRGGTPPSSLLREFEDALRERGWVSGQNITIEHRAAEGQFSAGAFLPLGFTDGSTLLHWWAK
jgi:hypothetical protein